MPTCGREITGEVVNALAGKTLIGAGLHIEQSPKTGTTTGLDGKFKLSTTVANPAPVCSYPGYETQLTEEVVTARA